MTEEKTSPEEAVALLNVAAAVVRDRTMAWLVVALAALVRTRAVWGLEEVQREAVLSMARTLEMEPAKYVTHQATNPVVVVVVVVEEWVRCMGLDEPQSLDWEQPCCLGWAEERSFRESGLPASRLFSLLLTVAEAA